MTQDEPRLIIGGVDAHADAHQLAALDARGALLSTQSFPATTPGYAQALDWLSGYGQLDAVAVESTGSYAAAFVRYLREHGGVCVFEVNQPHVHTRRRRGKSDPIDAEMAAVIVPVTARAGEHCVGQEGAPRGPMVWCSSGRRHCSERD
jgi:transposase